MFYPRGMKASAGRIARRGLPVAALCTLPLVGACSVDKILRVEDPDVATPASVNDSTALPAVYAGAISEFALAYGGSGNTSGGGANEGQILISGLLGDEFYSGDTFNTRNSIDARSIIISSSTGGSSNGQLEDAERNMQRARIAAENGAARFARLGKGSDVRRAEMLALAGYTYVMFGENYCNGTTFSSFPLDGGSPTFGSPMTNAETFQLAIARFDSALAIAPTGAIANLAKVGKGRALLDLGQFAAAGTAVTGVPASFEYAVPYSSNSSDQENGVWNYTVDARRYNVSNKEGGSGLPYRTEGIRTDSASKGGTDPRVPYRNGGRSFDTSVGTLWAQQKYPTRDADIPLATGAEAKLIQAEAALQAGSGTFITLLNDANTAAGGLGGLTDPGAAGNARAALLFKERGFSLWLTAHRLGDERRMMRQYGFTEAQSFPTGTSAHGDAYGTDKNLPIFIDEANNPNFVGCTNRNP